MSSINLPMPPSCVVNTIKIPQCIVRWSFLIASITAIETASQLSASSQTANSWTDNSGNSIQVQGNTITSVQCEGMSPGGIVSNAKNTGHAIQATIQCSESTSQSTSYFCKTSDMPNVRPWARSCGANGWITKQ